MGKPKKTASKNKQKGSLTVTAKISAAALAPKNPDSLSGWFTLYFQIHVVDAAQRTMREKKRDLQMFLNFFSAQVGHDHPDGWTPAVTKRFQALLRKSKI